MVRAAATSLYDRPRYSSTWLVPLDKHYQDTISCYPVEPAVALTTYSNPWPLAGGAAPELWSLPALADRRSLRPRRGLLSIASRTQPLCRTPQGSPIDSVPDPPPPAEPRQRSPIDFYQCFGVRLIALRRPGRQPLSSRILTFSQCFTPAPGLPDRQTLTLYQCFGVPSAPQRPGRQALSPRILFSQCFLEPGLDRKSTRLNSSH